MKKDEFILDGIYIDEMNLCDLSLLYSLYPPLDFERFYKKLKLKVRMEIMKQELIKKGREK